MYYIRTIALKLRYYRRAPGS